MGRRMIEPVERARAVRPMTRPRSIEERRSSGPSGAIVRERPARAARSGAGPGAAAGRGPERRRARGRRASARGAGTGRRPRRAGAIAACWSSRNDGSSVAFETFRTYRSSPSTATAQFRSRSLGSGAQGARDPPAPRRGSRPAAVASRVGRVRTAPTSSLTEASLSDAIGAATRRHGSAEPEVDEAVAEPAPDLGEQVGVVGDRPGQLHRQRSRRRSARNVEDDARPARSLPEEGPDRLHRQDQPVRRRATEADVEDLAGPALELRRRRLATPWRRRARASSGSGRLVVGVGTARPPIADTKALGLDVGRDRVGRGDRGQAPRRGRRQHRRRLGRRVAPRRGAATRAARPGGPRPRRAGPAPSRPGPTATGSRPGSTPRSATGRRPVSGRPPRLGPFAVAVRASRCRPGRRAAAAAPGRRPRPRARTARRRARRRRPSPSRRRRGATRPRRDGRLARRRGGSIPPSRSPTVCSYIRGKTTTSIVPWRSSSVAIPIVDFDFVITVRKPVTIPPITTRWPSSDSSFRSPLYAVTNAANLLGDLAHRVLREVQPKELLLLPEPLAARRLGPRRQRPRGRAPRRTACRTRRAGRSTCCCWTAWADGRIVGSASMIWTGWPNVDSAPTQASASMTREFTSRRSIRSQKSRQRLERRRPRPAQR